MVFMLTMLFACAPASAPTALQGNQTAAESVKTTQGTEQSPAVDEKDMVLPVRFQRPSYLVKGAEIEEQQETAKDTVVVKVGADISSPVPMTLRDILKILAEEQNMTVSWASDVNQNLKVDVGIAADDDFFQSLENLLRQVDYFHEMQGNTIVVKYMETRNFHLAMPPRITGSDASDTSSISSVTVEDSSTRWKEIEDNLKEMLARWESERPAPPPSAAPAEEGAAAAPAGGAEPAAAPAAQQNTSTIVTVDRAIGLITVTAPLRILKKVDAYLENFKKELYRQVAIEAKILEVVLDDVKNVGIDWSELVSNKKVTVQLFEGTGVLYPTGMGRKMFSEFSVAPTFDLIVNALKTYGETKLLSNPKISVMNGQPAVIYVGDNVTYIDSVTSTVGDGGQVSTSLTTAQASSGLRLEVVPTIVNDQEIILSLIPTISGVKLPIQQAVFGSIQIGLPEVKERTMNSIVRVGNGEMLVVGGLIDTTDDLQQNKLPLLGDMPFINRAFKSDLKTIRKKELIILLRPSII